MDRSKVIEGSVAVEDYEKVVEMRVNHRNPEPRGFRAFVLPRIFKVLLLH
jgi:hypothetical protein